MIFKTIRKPFKYSFNNVTLFIILINVAFYLFFQFYSPINKNYLSLSVVGFVYNKMYWQPLTYMFMHANFNHLFFNMFGLLIFGLNTERALGSKEFALLYMVTGILCGLFSLAVYYFVGLYDISIGNLIHVGFSNGIPVGLPETYLINLVGASGAIYAILFSYAVIFPRSRIFILGIIPVPAPILVAVYAIIEFGSQFISSSNVAHMTHLAGFGFAYLYFLIRMGVNPIKIWRNTYR
ncbi:rhomboid family intramembrane serine protease [Treponema zioleckii]|uniref:rhomboid family intramembrane serine protease n=1 Tax=Treponema zioleckii TaxID=331680 RepID=UPI00168B5CC5|nr:rhomboid family intramembrane serine protease [Treponema zioleckii]